MFTVYALHSPEYDKIYVGYTSDLESRMRSHNELGTKGLVKKLKETVWAKCVKMNHAGYKSKSFLQDIPVRILYL